jgi:glycosyltransferase involved in cell wall biosynthesis
MSLLSKQPRVSAVIPTRNRPELLRRALMSVLAQTIEDLEAVVVIDGPDPATIAMLEGIDDPRVNVVALPHSVGGSNARNIGAQMASGRWIALLDDDDEWVPEKTAVQLELAEQAGDRCFVVSEFIRRSDVEGDSLRPARLPGNDEPLSEWLFSRQCGFQTSSFFCSRKLFLEVPFMPGLKGCQDLDWFLRLVAAPDVKLVICRQPLAIFYVAENRTSVSRVMDVEVRLNWGRASRQFMTRRAYSLFVFHTCATRAAAEPFSLVVFARLFYECAFVGKPDLQTLAHLVALFFVPRSVRHKVRDWTAAGSIATPTPAKPAV